MSADIRAELSPAEAAVLVKLDDIGAATKSELAIKLKNKLNSAAVGAALIALMKMDMVVCYQLLRFSSGRPKELYATTKAGENQANLLKEHGLWVKLSYSEIVSGKATGE